MHVVSLSLVIVSMGGGGSEEEEEMVFLVVIQGLYLLRAITGKITKY